jgi:Mrp family chromosome partitioning ATPase
MKRHRPMCWPRPGGGDPESPRRAQPRDDGQGVLKLHVMTAGKPVRHPAEFFDSPAMRDLVEDRVAGYDAVVVGTPPVSQGPGRHSACRPG